jgi:hypothetical protein
MNELFPTVFCMEYRPTRPPSASVSAAEIAKKLEAKGE